MSEQDMWEIYIYGRTVEIQRLEQMLEKAKKDLDSAKEVLKELKK